MSFLLRFARAAESTRRYPPTHLPPTHTHTLAVIRWYSRMVRVAYRSHVQMAIIALLVFAMVKLRRRYGHTYSRRVGRPLLVDHTRQ